MWKVSNTRNKVILDKFHSKIIVPLFDFIIKLKENSYNRVNFEDFEQEILKLLDPLFPKNIFKIKHNEKECYKLILDLLNSKTLNELKEQKIMFESQNSSIDAGNYSLTHENVPDEFYRIFSNILYSKCFDDDACWEYIQTGFKYKRTDFHNNFKTENRNRTICSLCDTDTVIAKSNGIVEHFLPRNRFPYLSMNANNLITSCNACNLGEEGKGAGSVNPIWSPFSRQIGDNIIYNIEIDKITITPREGNIAIDNYLDLLKLNNRFSTKSVYNSSIVRLNAEISSHQQLSKLISVDNLLSYFTNNLESRKNEGSYFFKKNYFGDNYKEYMEELTTL
ncbi:hypothetical protein [Flavobacterium sp. ACAM 123]|uniref:hypothetical protein n=1 Tax=Flavobacterium sp. ACAM 123 TaxID=1189620 RepID=UPI0002F27145|nr:hypothetical protein [Flavobacterium sp. ACAM 123]